MNRPPPTNNDGRPALQAPEDAHQHGENFLDDVLRIPIDRSLIVTRAPEEPFRLTFTDVTCLVINRTIGTGIFRGPTEVMKGVRSPGIAVLMWILGCIYGLSGAHVFVEYGLNVPRYVINGVEQSVPRSGGELHYLQYVFPWPRYKKGAVLLSGVLFGISFICVGNMASNCIDCALRIMQAANPNKGEDEFSKGTIYGIAISIATVTCFIHAFSRRGGILLNNILAVIKVCVLISIIISTWVVAGGRFGLGGLEQGNCHHSISPPDPQSGPSGYTQAFLSVVFAFFGFDQPSYVLGEIKHPRKNLARSMWWGMSIVSVLYVAVNICYMIIVPADVQANNDVPQEFFRRISNCSDHAQQAFNSFLAISSFGNIVVWTFTAARMKQEIAKQCFLPYASFFAKNKDVSLGRLLTWLEGGNDRNPRGRRIKFLNPANHREKTPVGALILHLITCIILMMATYSTSGINAYKALSQLFSYILAAWFGTLLALGILILHFRGPPATQPVQTPKHRNVPDQQPIRMSWNQMIKGTVNPKIGVVCAGLYLVGSLYPVIMGWVPPNLPLTAADKIAWYVVPLAGWCVLAFSALWFLGFVAIATYRSRVGRKKFVYITEPEFDWAQKSQQDLGAGEGLPAGEGTSGANRGGLILIHETIYKRWQGDEMEILHNRAVGDNNALGPVFAGQRESNSEDQHGQTGAGLENTDFSRFRQ